MLCEGLGVGWWHDGTYDVENDEELQRLHGYLDHLGLAARRANTLCRIALGVKSGTLAVGMWPDAALDSKWAGWPSHLGPFRNLPGSTPLLLDYYKYFFLGHVLRKDTDSDMVLRADGMRDSDDPKLTAYLEAYLCLPA